MLDLLEWPCALTIVPDGFRRCSRCGEVKPIDVFPVKNKPRGLRRVWCRDCCRAYGREHYKRNRPKYLRRAQLRNRKARAKGRELIASYLQEHPCIDCGETDITLLDFDHRDGTTKLATISRLVHTGGWTAARVEIEKCDVRCANCHRRRTAQQLKWRKDPRRGALDPSTIASLGPVLTRPSSSGRPVVEQLSIWWIGVTRHCYKCGLDKPLHEFSLRDRATGERQDFCRSCQAAYRRDHYARNRERYMARAVQQMHRRREDQVRRLHAYLLAHPCVDCGESDIGVLEFDHIDPRTKTIEVSYMLGRRAWNVIANEIGKCDVVCANCHRKRTAEQQAWPKRFGEGSTSCGKIDLARE